MSVPCIITNYLIILDNDYPNVFGISCNISDSPDHFISYNNLNLYIFNISWKQIVKWESTIHDNEYISLQYCFNRNKYVCYFTDYVLIYCGNSQTKSNISYEIIL